VLRTTLGRFGIPARFYFADRLGDHPVCRFLGGVLEALLSGWDHARLLEILQLPVSGIAATAAGDRLDFAMRKQIPGSGLGSDLDALFATQPDGQAAELLIRLRGIDHWRSLALRPPEWSARFQSLRELLPVSQPEDGVSHERLAVWRAQVCALDTFELAVEEAGAALGDGISLTLAEFWNAARGVVNRAPLRVPDLRRDVVHVMDVYEARQWQLPVVFLCGLLERQFPQYPRQNPLLGDAARLALRGRGILLPTTADREQEERFLFQLAAGRATHHLILSYPEFNDKGEKSLTSVFLREFREQRHPQEQASRPVRPAPTRPPTRRRPSTIADPALREFLAQRHARLSPSGIEQYLQCPFQFFGGKSLALRAAPPKPEDRLNQLVQGSILHDALAEMRRTGETAGVVFDRVFRAACRKEHVPDSYRTEAVRLELFRHLSAFAEDRSVALPWISQVEEAFEFPVENGPAVRGRVDRMDIGPSGEALVIDYKHSGVQRLKERIKSTAAGDLVQAGLYLLAAERSLGLRPVGMLFCGLRKGVTWHGWHTSILGLEVGERCSSAMLRELMETAMEKSRTAHASILAGNIAPRPADEDKCRYCDYRDICRVEVGQAAALAGNP
jgi:RecB family exonuclease